MGHATKRARTDMSSMDTDDHDGPSRQQGTPGVEPVQILRKQKSRKIDKYTVVAGGTTWVKSANDGTSTNLWSYFPWEFINLFLTDMEAIEISQKYRYWKCVKAEVSFKNPKCVQSINAGTTPSDLAGVNDHAQLYTYLDDMWLTGVSQWPSIANDTLPVLANVQSLVNSWRTNGYTSGTARALEQLDQPVNRFYPASPDVETIVMGPGHESSYEWDCPSPYWRGTGELINGLPVQAGRETGQMVELRTGFSRWDEHIGSVGMLQGYDTADVVNMAVLNPQTAVNQDPNAGTKWRGYTYLEASLQSRYMPSQILFSTNDPMPRVWLTLQPQLGGLDSGIAQSSCQVDFEVKYTLLCTGRVPRELNPNSVLFTNPSNTRSAGVFAQTMESVNYLPIFRPVKTELDLDEDDAPKP